MLKIKRLYLSFGYALKGLFKVFKEEQNLKLQSLVGFLAVLAGLYYGIGAIEWLFLVFSIGLVLIMEVTNSAIERVTDLLKPRLDSYVKEIKDIMAAAVMLASLVSIAAGLLIFWNHVFGNL